MKNNAKIKFVAIAAMLLLAIATAVFFARSAQPVSSYNKENAALSPSELLFHLRNYPDQSIDLKAYSRALQQARSNMALKTLPGFDAAWTVRGPGNIGARINTVAVHPVDENIMYAGFAVGGLFKTTNGGNTWTPVFDEQPFLAIGCVTLDPQNPNVVYVGTGDPNISAYPFIGDGVYKSVNAGQSWEKLGLTDQRIISKIAVNPQNNNIIYAACMGLPFERNDDRGLYRSTDGGQNWQQVLFVSNQAGIIDLVMDPSNPDVLYAASWDRIRNNMESTVAGPNAKIYKTTDGGSNWVHLQNGLPSGNIGRIGLAISPSNPQIIYAEYVGLDRQLYNIYKTNNGGQSWTPTMQEADVPDLLPGALGGFGWYFGKIRVSPFDPDDIFVLGVDLWRSTDGGLSWFEASPPWWEYSVHADKHDLVITPTGDIILATDGGLYKSEDNSATWQDIENIPGNQVYRVAVNPFEPNWCYGGLQDNGSSGGPDLETEWLRIYGGDGFQMAFRPDNPGVVYAEIQNGDINVSLDGGNSWESATEGIPGGDRRHWDAPYFISSHNPDVLYTGTFRMYRSDAGAVPQWNMISDDLTDGIVFSASFHTISAIAESPVEEGLLYTGTTDGNVWRSDDTGQTWVNIQDGLPDRYVSSVKGSPNNDNTIFVTHTGYKSNDFVAHIHRSDDRGATWTPVAGNLPEFAVNDILVLPGYQDTVLFVATDGGVYGSTNAGVYWERLGVGMPIVPVFHLAWNEARNELVAGTHGRSIMTFPLDSIEFEPVTSVRNPIGNAADSPFLVFPSPAHSEFGISCKTQIDKADVQIFDGNGKLVWKKDNFDLKYSFNKININNWSTGVYFIIIKQNDRKWAHKLVKI